MSTTPACLKLEFAFSATLKRRPAVESKGSGSMKMNPAKRDVLILAAMIVIFGASPAFAYLDPGSGAAITSAILGFFAAITFTLRKYFHKLMRLVTRQAAKDKSE
jgi:hypothetical protein